mmetsp:Transcript_16234/g.21500  ORF Transcript_16234/g.21500 Transcript_16234/m.21500 type:complete len:315 (+) Transcript_16234:6-950(+)
MIAKQHSDLLHSILYIRLVFTIQDKVYDQMAQNKLTHLLIFALIASASSFILYQSHRSQPGCVMHSSTKLQATVESTDSSQFVKQELARKQAEYEEKRRAEVEQQAKNAQGSFDIKKLADLPFIQYVDASGKISNVGQTPNVKATAFAIFDSQQKMQYCGQTRNIGQSLRLMLARNPDLTHFVKVHHITKPSRTLLEVLKKTWIEENGEVPSGNDDGLVQASWEKPLDVKPLMTEEDRTNVEEAKVKGKIFEDAAIKAIARRFEEGKIKILEERGVTENLRFDPKLKGTGLLDLHCPKPKNNVPTSKPVQRPTK